MRLIIGLHIGSIEQPIRRSYRLLAGPPQREGQITIVMVCVVRLIVCYTRISLRLSEIDIWLLGTSNREPGFRIQNLPLDSRSEVQFRHFGCFRVGGSVGTVTTLGTEAGQLSSRPIPCLHGAGSKEGRGDKRVIKIK